MVAEQWIFFSVLGALQMLTSLSAWEQHCCALQQARPAIAAAVAHTIKLILQRGFIQAIACHQQPPNGSAIALLLAHLWGGVSWPLWVPHSLHTLATALAAAATVVSCWGHLAMRVSDLYSS